MVVSLLLGLTTFQFVPSTTLIGVSVLAGAAPDMDMLWEHRKTLHRPFQSIMVGFLFFLLYYISGDQILLLGAVGFYVSIDSLFTRCTFQWEDSQTSRKNG
jgi:hypothetical protein